MRALSEFFLPVFIIAVLAIGFFCRVNVYDSFVAGAREGVKLVLSVFPYICAVLIATELFSVSGMSAALTDLLAPLFRFLGIPEQLCELVIVRPLSGNGSLAVLEKLIAEYGHRALRQRDRRRKRDRLLCLHRLCVHDQGAQAALRAAPLAVLHPFGRGGVLSALHVDVSKPICLSLEQ